MLYVDAVLALKQSWADSIAAEPGEQKRIRVIQLD